MATEKQLVEQLVYEYGSRLYSFCRKLTASETEADDIYQQTFLRILTMGTTIDTNNNPAGFLMSVAARIWHDEIKKFARRNRIAPTQQEGDEEEIDLVADEKLTENLVESEQTKADIQNAVRALADPLRIPVLLYYMANLPVQVIAKSLGIPEGTVKSRLHKARQKLKAGLEEMGYEK